MQCTPHDLKEKLLKGLDEENNVVDMATVVAVISILEKYPMSREALEQTRIGRYVNELRKKTNDEQLAKRAKKLVKNWQQLVNSATPAVNGDNGERVIHPGVSNIRSNSNSPALGSLSPALHSVKSSQLKRLPGSKPNTPSLPLLKPNTPALKPNTPCQSAFKSKPNTPDMPHFSKYIVSPSARSTPSSSPKLHSTPKFINSPQLTVKNDPSCPSSTVSPVSAGSRPSTPLDTPIRPPSSTQIETSTCRLTRNRSQDSLSSSYSENFSCSSVHSSNMNGKSTNRKCDEKVSKTNVANRKRARLDLSEEFQNKTVKTDNCTDYSKLNGAVKSSSNTQKTNGSLSTSPSETSLHKSFSSRKNVNLSVNTDVSKTPKVKTTAQLIAELQAKSGSASVGSNVIKQIETNQIVKESDVPESVLPPGARPRRNKKRGLDQSLLDVSTPDRPHENLSQTKSELVQKFLQTAITPSSAVDMSPFKCDEQSESLERGEGSSIDVTDSSAGDIVYRSDEVKSQEQIEQESKNSKILSYEEIMSNLPPIDPDNILNDDEYNVSGQSDVTDDIIDLLHNSEWLGVNGNRDSRGIWTDWTQTFTSLSYLEEPLHILPYVLIDD